MSAIRSAIRNVIFVPALAAIVALGACELKKQVTMEDVKSDMKALDNEEKALEKVGLRFLVEERTVDGVRKRSMTFDKAFLKEFVDSGQAGTDREVYNKKMGEALNKYVAAGNGILGKYGNVIEVASTNGKTERYTLAEDVKVELEAKVDISKRLAEEMLKPQR